MKVKFFRRVGNDAPDQLERDINAWLSSPSNTGYDVVRSELSVASVGEQGSFDLVVISAVWYNDEGGGEVRRSSARIA